MSAEIQAAEARGAQRLAAEVLAIHARYFDLSGEPGVDDTTPEPEDVWRYDRDLRAVLGIPGSIHPGDFDGVAASAFDLGLTSEDVGGLA